MKESRNLVSLTAAVRFLYVVAKSNGDVEVGIQCKISSISQIPRRKCMGGGCVICIAIFFGKLGDVYEKGSARFVEVGCGFDEREIHGEGGGFGGEESRGEGGKIGDWE